MTEVIIFTGYMLLPIPIAWVLYRIGHFDVPDDDDPLWDLRANELPPPLTREALREHAACPRAEQHARQAEGSCVRVKVLGDECTVSLN